MEPWNTVWNVVCRDLLDRIEWLQKEQKRKGHEERERVGERKRGQSDSKWTMTQVWYSC
jgi:hypothetical protein